jgi:protein involved in temperature-dependent protein secretion
VQCAASPNRDELAGALDVLRGMTAEAAIERGEFRAALHTLQHETSGATAEPGRLLMRFNVEVRLQEFAAAEASIHRIVQIAPDVAAPMTAFAHAARAEQMAAVRLRDPNQAGQRTGVGLPPPYLLALVKAGVCNASGDAAGAVAALAEAKQMTPAITGTVTRVSGSTEPFTALADSDALTGATLPIYDGPKLVDVPFSDLRSVAFRDPKTTLDVMWLVADLELADGRRLTVRVPSLYPGTGLADDPTLRTGQSTAWQHERGYAVALGQRDLALSTPDGSSVMVGVLGIRRIDFNVAQRTAGAGGRGAEPGASATAKPVRAISGALVTVLGARAAFPLLSYVLHVFGLGPTAFELIRGALTLGSIVLYFVWFARLHDWLVAARGGAKYGKGLAIGGWFIPILNVALPYLALDDAARRALGRSSPAVLGWWASYLLMTLLSILFALVHGSAFAMPSATVGNALLWLSTLSTVAAYGLWALVVRDVTRAVR